MRILAVDMGTGTQDILLFDSEQSVENALQMIMPSATEIAAGRIRRATREGRPVVLMGVTAGGGPCAWALERHLKAGLAAFATPEAAKTFDDDLEGVLHRLGGVEQEYVLRSRPHIYGEDAHGEKYDSTLVVYRMFPPPAVSEGLVRVS